MTRLHVCYATVLTVYGLPPPVFHLTAKKHGRTCNALASLVHIKLLTLNLYSSQFMNSIKNLICRIFAKVESSWNDHLTEKSTIHCG